MQHYYQRPWFLVCLRRPASGRELDASGRTRRPSSQPGNQQRNGGHQRRPLRPENYRIDFWLEPWRVEGGIRRLLSGRYVLRSHPANTPARPVRTCLPVPLPHQLRPILLLMVPFCPNNPVTRGGAIENSLPIGGALQNRPVPQGVRGRSATLDVLRLDANPPRRRVNRTAAACGGAMSCACHPQPPLLPPNANVTRSVIEDHSFGGKLLARLHRPAYL